MEQRITNPSADEINKVISQVSEQLKNDPTVVKVRKGYRFVNGLITDEQLVVIEVQEMSPFLEDSKILPEINGIQMDVRTTDTSSETEFNLNNRNVEPRPGAYNEPPDLSLDLVKEKMEAIFHVSPDSGFPNLSAFLRRVKKQLTATMFEWNASHISEAIELSMKGEGKSVQMVTQKGKNRTSDAVSNLKLILGKKFNHTWASVTGRESLFPNSYHMKVASRDGEEFWLSSGNWKNSGQPDIDPAGTNSSKITPLNVHNREWHAIISNQRLATMFQKYIEFDYKEAMRVQATSELRPLDEIEEAEPIEIFVPIVFSEEPPIYTDPLVLDKELEIQPLLTPDRVNGQRMFIHHVIEMITKAKKTIYIQNQYIRMLSENEDKPECIEFLSLLKKKQNQGVEVRIILRDMRFYIKHEKDQHIERLKDFGIKTGIENLRFQANSHTKGIIVDTTEVLLGSQNLSTDGTLYNRDASLLIRDQTVAKYFEEIFLFDWNRIFLTQSKNDNRRAIIAEPKDITPLGYQRISFSELYD